MAGRGTDIILGGNAEYMARLKLREYFMPRIVEPEDEDSFGIARASGCHQELAVVRALFLARKLRPGVAQIFPTQLTRETEQLLKEAVEFAVQEYGERSLPELGRRPWQSRQKSTNRRPRHPKVAGGL